MYSITAYLEGFEFTFQYVDSDNPSEMLTALKDNGFVPQRPYVKKTEDKPLLKGKFVRYEERTDGKKGVMAIAMDADGKEFSTLQFVKWARPNMFVEQYVNEKGYVDLQGWERDTVIPF